MKTTTQTGFTLTELMVTVAIVGILATVAMPSYQAYIQKSRRAEAASALMQNAQFLERNYTDVGRYDIDSAGTAIVLPITVSPTTGTTLYNVTATTLARTSYTLTATPVTADPDCGALSLNQLGQKTIVADATSNVDTCWQL